MKIIVVSIFYSEGMGYSENCLPKALAATGHEVHVLTSNLNVYGNESGYLANYESFLGPADQGVKTFETDGYIVHRLPSSMLLGYVYIKNLIKTVREISPDIVHSTEIASFQTYMLAAYKPFSKFILYTETHQHMSVVKPFLKLKNKALLKKLTYKMTRTLPTFFASLFVKRCYAISPDCAEVAHKYFGVPFKKIKVQSLGTDTDLFRSAVSEADIKRRNDLREKLGYNDSDVVCIYTGRFSADKNPLLLAKAVKRLVSAGLSFHGLFIGEGPQGQEIAGYPNVKLVKFVKHKDLADFYLLSDMAVWPSQESLSMLDAASCGLPLIVSDSMGDSDRILNSGKFYKEGDVDDLSNVIKSLADKELRMELGKAGREKMENYYSWLKIARELTNDFLRDRK